MALQATNDLFQSFARGYEARRDTEMTLSEYLEACRDEPLMYASAIPFAIAWVALAGVWVGLVATTAWLAPVAWRVLRPGVPPGRRRALVRPCSP